MSRVPEIVQEGVDFGTVRMAALLDYVAFAQDGETAFEGEFAEEQQESDYSECPGVCLSIKRRLTFSVMSYWA